MTQREFLLERFQENHKIYVEQKKTFFENPSIARIEPFKIADGLYYVGDKKVCIHLIDAGDGLVLIDSGFPGATHLLIDSIWRLGFDPANVRWIIHTHGHYDHFGASDEFKKMYGTKLAISSIDAQSLREKPHRAHLHGDMFPFARLPEFDYEIEDGEIFEYGNVKIRCVLTPGHTQGVLSLFFDVTDNGTRYLAGLFGGAGVAALTLTNMCYNEDTADCPVQMLDSIEKIQNEPVVIHLGNHPYNNKTVEKRQIQIEKGGNPFVAPESWYEFLEELKSKVKKIILENEKLKKEMDSM